MLRDNFISNMKYLHDFKLLLFKMFLIFNFRIVSNLQSKNCELVIQRVPIYPSPPFPLLMPHISIFFTINIIIYFLRISDVLKGCINVYIKFATEKNQKMYMMH